MIYKVITLENWSDGFGGWVVNDAHYTGSEITLEKNFSIVDIMRQLKDCGEMAKHVTRRSIEIDDYDATSITIKEKVSGKYLWELRPVVDNN